jgi:hypothetical protein
MLILVYILRFEAMQVVLCAYTLYLWLEENLTNTGNLLVILLGSQHPELVMWVQVVIYKVNLGNNSREVGK